MSESFEQRVLRIVAAIPKGSVASYGQIARLAGEPARARHVGRALALCDDPDIPWHRVVNAAGQIRSPNARRQADELRAEGVTVADHRVRLRLFGWQPGWLAFT